MSPRRRPRPVRLWSWHTFRCVDDRSNPLSRPIIFDFESDRLYPRAWCPRLRRWYHFESVAEWYFSSLSTGEKRELCMQYLRVIDGAKLPKGGKAAAVDESFRKDHPAIAAYLTELYMPDGKTGRQVSSLMVFCEEGVWKACLNDREQGYSMWATGSGFAQVLTDLENRLVNDPGGWRRNKVQGKRR